MWSAVVDGINSIGQMVHASNNPYAQKMDNVSTSQAVQQAAQQRDKQYEEGQAKLMQLNQQLYGLGSAQRSARVQTLRNKQKDLLTQMGQLRKQQSAATLEEGRNQRANENNQTRENVARMNNETSRRNNAANNATSRANAQDRIQANANKPIEVKETDEERHARIQQQYDDLPPEGKEYVDKKLKKAQKTGSLGDKKRYEEMQKAIEDYNHEQGNAGQGNGNGGRDANHLNNGKPKL